ncbi:MAG: ABC transporter ATP-binding protein [Acidimicrobiales bacterium]
MAQVVFQGATRIYDGTKAPAVNQLSLDIADGEFVVLVGPSGSGKSTALRMLAGLEPLDAGSIHIGDEDVTDRAPKDRDIAMVFQNYALFPHLDVAGNIEFGLKLRRVPKRERAEKVRQAAAILGLEEYLGRKPSQLSGGQRQRVAMGRAIVREPKVFLMDEPLSNLDAKLRTQTRTEIASLQRRLNVTTVYVTHDQVEAMTMGDRVAVMREGLLQQVGTPRQLYERPVNTFVAGFIGSPAMNLRRVKVDGDGVRIGASSIALPEPAAATVRASGLDEVVIGARPEACALSADGCPFEVELVAELGADSYVYGRVGSEEAGDPPFAVRVSGIDPPRAGERLGLSLTTSVHVFEPGSGNRIGS